MTEGAVVGALGGLGTGIIYGIIQEKIFVFRWEAQYSSGVMVSRVHYDAEERHKYLPNPLFYLPAGT